jgi:leucyl-tRNA synthetase
LASITTILTSSLSAIEGHVDNAHLDEIKQYPLLISLDFVNKHRIDHLVTSLHVDVNIVDGDYLDMEAFTKWRPDYENAVFITNSDGKYLCGSMVEKMSKSKYNVVNPDLMVERYGADCFRMYEMFLGPIEQSKPWDTKGIEGVSKFLRKLWSLFINENGLSVSDNEPTKAEYKILHTAIKKLSDDIERFSFNTCVSSLMVATNDLKKEQCNKRAILQPLVVMIAPFAPHLAEELWHQLGNGGTVHNATFPTFEEKHLKEDSIAYPICINGKKRATVDFATDASEEDMKKIALELREIQKWVDGKPIKKVIVIPNRMINVVI